MAFAASPDVLKGGSTVENTAVVSPLPAAKNNGSHDTSIRNKRQAVSEKIHAEAQTLDNDAITSSEDENNGCEKQEDEWHVEPDKFEAEVDTILRKLLDTVQIRPTDISPIGIPVDIEHMPETENPSGSGGRSSVIRGRLACSNPFARAADLLWLSPVSPEYSSQSVPFSSHRSI